MNPLRRNLFSVALLLITLGAFSAPHPAEAAGFGDYVTAPLSSIASVFEGALGALVSVLEPHGAVASLPASENAAALVYVPVPTSTPQTVATTTVIYKYVTAPSSPALTITSGGVSQAELNQKLQEIDDALQSQIAAITSGGPLMGQGGLYNEIAASNKVDQLSGVTITNSTIDAASIPNLAGTYLPLTGGTVSGTFTVGSSTAASFIVANNGFVGIGTSSPFATLSVSGNSFVSGTLTVKATTTASSLLSQIFNGCYNTDQYSSIQSAIDAASTTGCVTITPLTTDTSTWWNPNGLTIIDQRPTSRVGEFLGGASVSPKLANFANGSIANKTIVYFGNSTVWNAINWFTTMAGQDIPGGILQGMNIHQDLQSVSSDSSGNMTVVLGSPSGFTVGKFGTVEFTNPGSLSPCTGIVTAVSGNQFTLANCTANISNTSIGGGIASQQLLNFGNNGWTLAAMLADTSATSTGVGGVCAVKPDLLIVRGPLINDVRTGNTDLAQAEALERQLLDTVRSCTPNTDILLKTENSLLTTNVNNSNFVTPNSAAQAYSTILEQAVMAFTDVYPNVVTLDTQKGLYGTTSPALSAYMQDQLHPNGAGQNAEAQEDIQVLRQLMNNGYQTVGAVDPNALLNPPFSPYLAADARANNYNQPWSFYPYACADPNYYTLIGQGAAAANFNAGSAYFNFTMNGSPVSGSGQSSVIQGYDVVEQQGAGCWQLPPGTTGGSYGGGSTYNTQITLGSGSTTPYAINSGEQISIWRPKYYAQTAEQFIKNPDTYTYRRRVVTYGGSGYFQFQFMTNEHMLSAYSDVQNSDFLALDGTSTLISLSSCSFSQNFSQGIMSCYMPGDWSSLNGQYGWLIGQQPMEGQPNSENQLLVGASRNPAYAPLSVWGPDTSASTLAFNVVNSASTTLLSMFDNGNLAIGTTTPYSPLEVWGPDTATTTAFDVINNASTTAFAVYDNGNATYSGSLFQSSDERLKTDVTSLNASSSLAEVEALNPVSYLRIDQPSSGENLGFLAQQAGSVFPELVSTTSATALTPGGTLTLNYVGLIAPIVKSIQALAGEVASLQGEVGGFAAEVTTQVLTATHIESNDIHTTELCVGTTCIDQQQLAALLAGSDVTLTTPTVSVSTSTASTSTPPVLSINGNNPAEVEVGSTYSDLGATITGPSVDLNLGADSDDCGRGFRLNAATRSDRKRPPVPGKAAGVSLPA